jgi:HPt (histidine-containing phosphotransfer) domain-containing protein
VNVLHKFRTAIIVVVTLSAILPVSLVSSKFGYDIYSITRETALDKLNLTSKRANEQLKSTFESLITGFKALSLIEDIMLAASSSIFGGGASNAMREFMTNNPMVSGIYILNTELAVNETIPESLIVESNELVMDLVKSELMNDGQRPLAMAVRRDDEFLATQIGLNKTHDLQELEFSKHMVLMASRLKDSKKNTIGYLVCVIPLGYLQKSVLAPLVENLAFKVEIEKQKIIDSFVQGEEYLTSSHNSQIESKIAGVDNVMASVTVGAMPELLFYDVKNKIIRLTLIFVVVLAISILTAFLFSKTLSGPINSMIPIINKFIQHKYDIKMPRFRYVEFATLCDVLERMSASIRNHQATLEQQVAQRTSELRRKTNDMSTLLSNVQFGVVTLDRFGFIGPEYSGATEQILEVNELAKKSIFEVFLSQCDIGQEKQDQIREFLLVCLDEDEFSFSINQAILPRDVRLSCTGTMTKDLRLEWSPIRDNNNVESILLTIKDLTDAKMLEKKLEQQSFEIEISNEILTHSIKKVEVFFRHNEELIATIKKITAKGTPQDSVLLKRNLHTLKGNARAFGFKLLSNKVHLTETLVQNNDDRFRALTQLITIYDLYHEVFHKKFGILSNLNSNSEWVPKGEVIAFIEQQMAKELVTNSSAECARICTELKEFLRVKNPTIRALVTESLDGNESVWQEYRKERPLLFTQSGEIELDDRAVRLLKNVFNLLIPNSLIHGIESGEERIKKAKLSEGHIFVDCCIEENLCKIKYRDDGAGLNIGLIALKAGLSPEQVTPEKITSLVFSDNFSTLDEIKDAAGRGVGMAAIKYEMESAGGKVDLILDSNQLSPDQNCGFALLLTIPSSLISWNPYNATSSKDLIKTA